MKYLSRKFLERMLLLTFSGFTYVLPMSVVFWLGKGIARLFYWLYARKRREALQNILMAFPEISLQKARACYRESLENLAYSAIEFLSFSRRGRTEVKRAVREVEGKEILRQAYDQGKGVILISAHLGNWELLGAWLAISGFPLVAVEKEQEDSFLNRLILNTRKKMSIELISKDEPDFRDLLRALKRGKGIGLISDQHAGKRGVPSKFLGRTTSTFAGPVLLARASGAPVIPIFDIRLGPGAHKIVAYPPLPLQWEGNLEQAVLRNVQLYTDAIANMVRKYPGQWLWLHRRWREGEEKMDASFLQQAREEA